MRHLGHLGLRGVLCLLLCGCATRVEAQAIASSFDQLVVLVKPGDRVKVVDVTGREAEGRIGTLSRDALLMMTEAGPRKFGEADVAQILQRRQDSLKNGAIIGAVAAAGYVATILTILTAGGAGDGGDVLIGPAIVGIASFVGIGAAAGAGIDALITRRQVIYLKPAGGNKISVGPMFGNGRRGAAVTVRF